MIIAFRTYSRMYDRDEINTSVIVIIESCIRLVINAVIVINSPVCLSVIKLDCFFHHLCYFRGIANSVALSLWTRIIRFLV